MWFENPFRSNDPDNLALLLRNLGLKQAAEKKRSTTVDVWRGNYNDFISPKPKITIIKKYNSDPKDEIAEVKTLFPEALPATPRTLLCHHATDKSGHTTCDYPGKCNIHKLTKPSAFEVSKLDQCRTVIDLYEQGIMEGVINAQQRISRDATHEKYTQKGIETTCATHAISCDGDCGSHGTPYQDAITTTPSLSHPVLAYTTDTRANIDKQVVVSKKQDPNSAAKLTTYGNKGAKKSVTFSDKVRVKCVNPRCGRTSFVGENCETEEARTVDKSARDMVTLSIAQNAAQKKPITPSCKDANTLTAGGKDTENMCDSTCGKSLPSCYYKHAHNRMSRLKDKSKTLVEKIYAPPSSLAKPGTQAYSLVKKYNNAKQNKIKKKKFVIPNVDPDCLWQPTRPHKPRKAAPSMWTSYRPTPPEFRINMREIYPRKRSGKMKVRERLGNSSIAWDDKIRSTIKVAVDDIGPLVYAVQDGKIQRMKVEGTKESCHMEI